jgi:adenine-specific DNA-methyltransferase
MSKHIELVAKLREIFQIDRPDLDFGIYRILNTRAVEINAYLEQRLPEKVKAALTLGSAAQQEQVGRELQDKEAQYQADGIDPGTVPKVRELREKLAQYQAGASEHENAVFSHLLAFFSRYYKDGDFISQRRYKGDTYAIPYAGEEVMLHWANKDQYYTKSGENFANYSFKLGDGRTVHFRLVAADTAKDNRKDNDKERRFELVVRKTVTRVDEQGDQVEEELIPVEEVDGANGKELVVRFDYTSQPKGTKQEALVQKAVAAVLAEATVKDRWLALGGRAPTEKDPQRTLVEKHLADYTTRNTADYFIHKDLGGFLRRELDFYIKNEVMNLDDVQNASAFGDIEKSLRMIQCLRGVALELISFLSQLENFQKKLWLKKKFVVSSHYCITLDRIPESLYPTIAANEKQWIQWSQLGVWKGQSPGTVVDLKAGQFLMVDTSLFDLDFRSTLLNQVADLDASTNGIAIHADNFQAISLIAERYSGQIEYVYIDPPYNTTENAFAYKNQYKHSSWASLIHTRLSKAYPLVSENGVCAVAIDDTESGILREILGQIFGAENYVSTVAVEVNPAGQNLRPNTPARSHDYFHVYAKDIDKMDMLLRGLTPEEEKAYKEQDEQGFYLWDNLRRRGGNSRPVDRPKQYFPLYASLAQKKVSTEPFEGCEEVWPIDPKGEKRIWRVNKDGAARFIASGDISILQKAGRTELVKKTRMPEGKKPKTLWYESGYSATTYGTKLLIDIIGEQLFSYPKALGLVTDALSYWLPKDGVVLDFFAGSGTTAHATISLNRNDGGSRQYIVVEQGDYFETVLKPRIQKVVHSSEWKSGKPCAVDTGISHCVKILKLESYEDTLNNLQLYKSANQDDLFAKLPQQAAVDYLLNYMLDVESRDSLLSLQDFKTPFDYRLNIAVDSAGAFEPRKVDLVETFNYLIGLRVKQIDAQLERGFVTVAGTLPTGETCLVLWRDCEKLDYEGITKLCDRLAINPADNEYDVVYINGDHNIPTVLTQTAEEGGATRVLKLRQIEPEFLERMFSTEDV